MEKLNGKDKYSLELPKLKEGSHEIAFEIDRSFFDLFEYSVVQEGKVDILAEIIRYHSHLDASFFLKGDIILHCDRCGEPYSHAFERKERVIFSYEDELAFDTDEVVQLSTSETTLDLSKDFYEFIHLEIPLRKVPEEEIHKCSEEVLKILNRESTEEDTDEIDPRWEILRKLKDNTDK